MQRGSDVACMSSGITRFGEGDGSEELMWSPDFACGSLLRCSGVVLNDGSTRASPDNDNDQYHFFTNTQRQRQRLGPCTASDH